MKHVSIAILSIAIPTSLIAEPQQPQPQPQAQAQAQLQPLIDLTKFASGDETKSDVDRVICREQSEIGSRLMHNKVCLTNGQWLQYEADNREHIQQMERLGMSGN